MSLISGFSLAALVAAVAYKTGSLSRSGAMAAILSGGLIFGLGDFKWTSLLLGFFISSSLLSRAFAGHKIGLSDKFAKGSQRDASQVLANSGVGVCLVLINTFMPGQDWVWVAYAGAMAAVNADTWATELGVLNPQPPRLVTTGAQVARGTSGGVSLMGSMAALGGGAWIGLLAMLWSNDHTGWQLFFGTMLAGLAGSFFDSLLGATVQAIYTCPVCHKETERYPIHTCGAQTRLIRGWSWLNNDLVNLAASIFGVGIALSLWYL